VRSGCWVGEAETKCGSRLKSGDIWSSTGVVLI